MDPERLAIMEALRRLGAVPHQRDLNIAPRSESYMDALSEADQRDLSANEQFVQRNAPVVIPEYHDESDPYEMEPDNDFDDYGGSAQPNPGPMMDPALMALQRMRGGR